MSRFAVLLIYPNECVPRASGDEPTIRAALDTLEECSPRERG